MTCLEFTDIQIQLLRRLARRYIWWMTSEDALKDPARIIQQVMEIGTFEDAQSMFEAISPEYLSHALKSARGGVLSGPS